MLSVVVINEGCSMSIRDYLIEVARVLKRIDVVYEIIVIDNGRTKESNATLRDIAKDFENLRVISLFEKSPAKDLSSLIFRNCLGSHVVVLNSREDPSYLIEEASELLSSGFLYVGGEYESDDNPQGRKAFEELVVRLLSLVAVKLLGVKVAEKAVTFRAYNRVIGRSKTLDGNPLAAFENSIGRHPSVVSVLRYRPLEMNEQKGGKSVRSFLSDLSQVVFSSTRYPLRVLSLFSLMFAGANLLYGIYVIVAYSTFGVVEGWTTISLQTSGLFFCCFIVLAGICEYLGRITELMFFEKYVVVDDYVSQRISYGASEFVKEEHGGDFVNVLDKKSLPDEKTSRSESA